MFTLREIFYNEKLRFRFERPKSRIVKNKNQKLELRLLAA